MEEFGAFIGRQDRGMKFPVLEACDEGPTARKWGEKHTLTLYWPLDQNKCGAD